MESNKIMQADILDILFDGRNKEYGAYDLRKTYNKRLYKAIAVTGTVIVLVMVGGMVMGRGGKKVKMIQTGPEIELVDVAKKVEPPPVIPPPVQLPPPQVRMTAFTPPRIVPTDQVRPEDMPPEQDDLDKVKIGAANKEGNDFDGTVGPTPSDNGTGVVEAPKKKDDEPEIWTKVEIDAAYPGGMPAWMRFMNKSFQYPEDALSKEIGGTVVVQFVVDKEGNVSDVQAVSGPTDGGLREEAVRVIRKSGKWTPAIQNGNNVKAYKRQPIIFVLPQ